MKKIIVLLIVAFLVFVFFASGTWETRKESVRKNGVEYFITRHTLHWDKYAQYVKEIPQKIQAALSRF